MPVNLSQCPYCGSLKYGKVNLDGGKEFVLVVKDPSPNPPSEGKKVNVFGCADCKMLTLQSEFLQWN